MSTPFAQARSTTPAAAPAGAPPAGEAQPPDLVVTAITQPPVFALTLRQHHPNDFIDYGSSQGLKLWYAATDPIPEV